MRCSVVTKVRIDQIAKMQAEVCVCLGLSTHFTADAVLLLLTQQPELLLLLSHMCKYPPLLTQVLERQHLPSHVSSSLVTIMALSSLP